MLLTRVHLALCTCFVWRIHCVCSSVRVQLSLNGQSPGILAPFKLLSQALTLTIFHWLNAHHSNNNSVSIDYNITRLRKLQDFPDLVTQIQGLSNINPVFKYFRLWSPWTYGGKIQGLSRNFKDTWEPCNPCRQCVVSWLQSITDARWIFPGHFIIQPLSPCQRWLHWMVVTY